MCVRIEHRDPSMRNRDALRFIPQHAQRDRRDSHALGQSDVTRARGCALACEREGSCLPRTTSEFVVMLIRVGAIDSSRRWTKLDLNQRIPVPIQGAISGGGKKWSMCVRG
jgi:hypothetical protein